MVDTTKDHGPGTIHEDKAPNTPYEHCICGATLISSLLFLVACAYFIFAPADSAFRMPLLTATGGLFVIVLAGFFFSAFCGKICGESCEEDD